MKTLLKCLWGILFVVVITFGGGIIWIILGNKTSNPYNYRTLGDIPVPITFKRVTGENVSYVSFLRSLPLKGRGAKVQLYKGGNARFQSLNYAVINMHLISNAEQCADVCMRLRAEYLFNTGQYNRICFQNVNGRKLNYSGGPSRKAFERYLRNLYGVASTFSLSREMQRRQLKEIEPGDVFVYPARNGQKYGHAMMVADVAVDKKGRKAILLIEGNTPAREIHVVRNVLNPIVSPWFIVNDDADDMIFSVFHYKAKDLRHF